MKKVLLYTCLAMLPLSYAAAEGYQANVQSSKQTGMGHVGTAMKLGAESMHFNPAGLGFLEKNIDISVGVAGIFTKADYKSLDGSYKRKSDNDPSTPFYVYAGFKIYDNLSAGVSLTTPYGSAMNWGKDWRGAHLVQDISLKSFSIQPTISYRPFDRLSIGAGLMVMFGNFTLSRALAPAGSLEALRGLAPYLPHIQLESIIDKYKDIPVASATLSGDAGLRAGFNVGAMFDVTDQFTIGLSYRSKVKMKVKEGTAEMQYANKTEIDGLIAAVNPLLGENAITIPPLDQGTFKAALPLPSNFNIGLTYKPTDRWMLSGEVQFVGWGTYDKLNVNFLPDDVLGKYNISAPKEYKNTRIYRLGGQFAATNRLDLRLGAYFDESPVKKEFLNPETPSMDKLGLTTGLSFRPNNLFSVDFGFSYVTGFGRKGSYPVENGSAFEGDYGVHAFIASLGLTYSF